MTNEKAKTPCPQCSAVPEIVWRHGGVFQQRTECVCGRITNWVQCCHDAAADSTDDERGPRSTPPEGMHPMDKETAEAIFSDLDGLYDASNPPPVEPIDGAPDDREPVERLAKILLPYTPVSSQFIIAREILEEYTLKATSDAALSTLQAKLSTARNDALEEAAQLCKDNHDPYGTFDSSKDRAEEILDLKTPTEDG